MGAVDTDADVRAGAAPFDAARAHAAISASAAGFGYAISPGEVAELAFRNGYGEAELAVVSEMFSYMAERNRARTVETMLRLSRLPLKVPKTFEGFDFDRIQGRDADVLRRLPALENLHARKNLAFIGPGGIGKTHLAQAYGRECCLLGYKAYYIKATELRDRLRKAAASQNPSRTITSLVKPSCLIVDEIGRCSFDRECTDMFFDIVDRRYEKEGPNTMIVTSNTPVSKWDAFFTGDDTLLCMLDRVFDKASVFVMKGASFRGAGCETFAVETRPTATRVNR